MGFKDIKDYAMIDRYELNNIESKMDSPDLSEVKDGINLFFCFLRDEFEKSFNLAVDIKEDFTVTFSGPSPQYDGATKAQFDHVFNQYISLIQKAKNKQQFIEREERMGGTVYNWVESNHSVVVEHERRYREEMQSMKSLIQQFCKYHNINAHIVILQNKIKITCNDKRVHELNKLEKIEVAYQRDCDKKE